MKVILKPGAIVVLAAILATLLVLVALRRGATDAGSKSAADPARGGLLTPLFFPYRMMKDDTGATEEEIPSVVVNGSPTVLLRATVKHPSQNSWDVQAGMPMGVSVAAGERFDFIVWARSRTKSRASFQFQQTKQPYTHFLERTETLTPEWKRYHYVFSVPKAFPVTETSAVLFFGQDAGEIEVALPSVTRVAAR